jgi:hypothetical protein
VKPGQDKYTRSKTGRYSNDLFLKLRTSSIKLSILPFIGGFFLLHLRFSIKANMLLPTLFFSLLVLVSAASNATFVDKAYIVQLSPDATLPVSGRSLDLHEYFHKRQILALL